VDAIQEEKIRMSMHPKKRSWIWLIVLCGTLVPVSYVHGLVTHPEARGELWGGVPEALQPLYTVCMLLAASGFFLFTGFILFRVDPKKDPGDGRPGFGIFPLLYALILIPSALWLPLTFAYMEHPSTWLWWVIRTDLFLVGLGALGLFPALLAFRSGKGGLFFILALLGLVFFSWQTAVLDALVWPHYFPQAS
jgi:hypothetical protein